MKPHRPERPSFIDLPKDSPYYGIIEGIKAGGLIAGYPDGSIKAEKNLTREELALLLGWYTWHGSVVNPFGNILMLIQGYPDRNQIGEDFKYAVAAYISDWKKVFDNTPELLRAEAAHLIVMMVREGN